MLHNCNAHYTSVTRSRDTQSQSPNRDMCHEMSHDHVMSLPWQRTTIVTVIVPLYNIIHNLYS